MTTVSASGMRVLIVGASSGIGRSLAEALVNDGARVVASARRGGLLAEIPGLAATVAGDVRSPDDCGRMVGSALEVLGGLDALVYGAASLPLGWLAETDADIWHNVLETGVIGAAIVTRAALTALRESRGRVVYLSSDAVARPQPGLVPYLVDKAALDTLLVGWRNEVPDVSFTRVVVGPTITGISSGWDPDLAAEMFALWQADNYGRYRAVMTSEQVAEQVLAALTSPVAVEDLAVRARLP